MWFNISDADTMDAVIGYFGDHGFAYPWFFGPLSAWAQFFIGMALILGLLTRWAGVLLAFNFVVGIIMVHWGDSFRDCWPPASLIAIGLIFATFGGGRFAVDRSLEKR
jgi:putative oxidoreductase